LLPELECMGIEVQLVTSAVRPIPREWVKLNNLHIAVSIDGLQPQHDRRRFPATYERILQNIADHRVIVHCTITRQFAATSGGLVEFARFWSARSEVRKIWFSLYTPQEGEDSEERLHPENRVAVLAELTRIR
jgi:sulfatase maturation enzyme AslB (radical SAM superfamily)